MDRAEKGKGCLLLHFSKTLPKITGWPAFSRAD